MLPEARRTLGVAHDGGARRLVLGVARRRRAAEGASASRSALDATLPKATRLVSNPIPVSLANKSVLIPIGRVCHRNASIVIDYRAFAFQQRSRDDLN